MAPIYNDAHDTEVELGIEWVAQRLHALAAAAAKEECKQCLVRDLAHAAQACHKVSMQLFARSSAFAIETPATATSVLGTATPGTRIPCAIFLSRYFV